MFPGPDPDCLYLFPSSQLLCGPASLLGGLTQTAQYSQTYTAPLVNEVASSGKSEPGHL